MKIKIRIDIDVFKPFRYIFNLFSGIYLFLKVFIGQILLMAYAGIFGYYSRLDRLPIFNWFELIKGNYKYIYKRPINKHPAIFGNIYVELFYQFEKVDMSYFEDIHKLAYLNSLYVTTKKTRFLNQANTLKAKINKKDKAEIPKLNDMINLIEETFNSIGTIDKFKMDTLRFYSLYYRACDKINAKNKK